MKKFGLLILGAILALVLTACGEAANIEKVDPADKAQSGTEQKPDAKKDEDKAEDKTEEKVAPAEQKLKIGDSVNFDGLIITLNEVRIEKGGEWDEPEKEQFVVVNLTAENTTDEEQTVSSIMNVELRDTDGYKYNTTFLMEGLQGEFDGSIEPGGKLRGEIPFDVPLSDEYQLYFSDLFKSGSAIWVIPSGELK